MSTRCAVFVVVDGAVGNVPDAVGTPVVLKVEIEVPAISCDAAVELVSALPVVLTPVPEVVLATGGSDVAIPTVLKTGFCVPVDAVAYGAIVAVSLKMAHSSATAAMVAGRHVSAVHVTTDHAYCRSRFDCMHFVHNRSRAGGIDHIHTNSSIGFARM